MSDFLYPLDVTGSQTSNRVRGEFQTLTPPVQSDNFHFILSKSGPYYRDTMIIRHVPTDRVLIRGIDWEPGHIFNSATFETEHVKGGIYQSILFLDRTLDGQIELVEYNVLGGQWSLDENKLLEILSNKLIDPRQASYEQVSGKPEVFPPQSHMHQVNDFIGMREQVEATNQVAGAIREQTENLAAKLAVYLNNYYSKSDIDQLIMGVSSQLIEGIAGPQLDIILREIVNERLLEVYTKTEIDTMLLNITNLFNKYYDIEAIDLLLAGKVDNTTFQQGLSDKTTKSYVDTLVSSSVDGLATKTSVTDLSALLIQKETGLQQQINIVNSIIAGLGGQVQDYVTRDEIENMDFGQEYDVDELKPATIINPYKLDLSTGTINTNGSGIVTSVEVSINTVAIVDISTDGRFKNEVNLDPITFEVDVNPDNLMEPAHTFIIYAEYVNDEWLFTRDYITIQIVDQITSDVEGSVDWICLQPACTTANKIAIGALNIDGQNVTVTPLLNTSKYNKVERRTKTLTSADLEQDSVHVFDFESKIGHDSVSVLTSIKLKDQYDNFIPASGYKHIYKPMIFNKVEINIPAVYTDHYSTPAEFTLHLEVYTKTISQ